MARRRIVRYCLKRNAAAIFQGFPYNSLQRRLEHSMMDVTSKRYLHATKAMEDESIEKMNRKFLGIDDHPDDPSPIYRVK